MKTLLLHPNDSVKVVVESDNPEFFPGIKIARQLIKKNSSIIKYGVKIGVAKTDIEKGDKVNEDVMGEIDTFEISRKNESFNYSFKLPERLKNFYGYLNKDGSAGTRNYLCISTSVNCVAGVVEHAVKKIKEELLPKYKKVDGIVLLNHTYGCGVAINAKDSNIPKRTLVNLTLNPNFGRYCLLVGLGCEKMSHEIYLKYLSNQNEKNNFVFDSIYFQDINENGFNGIINEVCKKAEEGLKYLNQRKRCKIPISKLNIGMQCGGSDGLSGITANPLLGVVSDLIINQGGTTIFSENTECMDAEKFLISRCKNYQIADKLKSEFDWYRSYLEKNNVDRSANITPGNKSGGLSSISEKALGSISKSGSKVIEDVISPGERTKRMGLNFLSGPASDFICGTLQLAAGANIHIFTTGRGTPYSIDGFPVIKISSNSKIYKKWFDIIDFDAGKLIYEQELNEVALDLFSFIIKVASGEKTCAEKLNISNGIVLFNPAPIT